MLRINNIESAANSNLRITCENLEYCCKHDAVLNLAVNNV